MAKDPAFLFYTQDFQTGTQFFTDEQVGKYIRLLCAQHQHGHLSEKHMLSICKAYDEDVLSKFKKDEEGKYYNERLDTELVKRKLYTESRRNNAKGSKKNEAHDEHMLEHMENENSISVTITEDSTNKESKDCIIVEEEKPTGKKKKFVPPTVEQVIEYFLSKGYSEAGARKAHEYYRLNNWKDREGKQVIAWKQKMFGNWMRDEYKIKTPVVTMPQPTIYRRTASDPSLNQW